MDFAWNLLCKRVFARGAVAHARNHSDSTCRNSLPNEHCAMPCSKAECDAKIMRASIMMHGRMCAICLALP